MHKIVANCFLRFGIVPLQTAYPITDVLTPNISPNSHQGILYTFAIAS